MTTLFKGSAGLIFWPRQKIFSLSAQDCYIRRLRELSKRKTL
jgi:hypothetical protein